MDNPEFHGVRYFLNGALHFNAGQVPEGATELSAEDYDKVASGNFIVSNGEVIPYVAPIIPWSPNPLLNKVRAARDVAAARLDGIAGRMTRAGDTTGIAAACDEAVVSLLNITTIPDAKAATNDAELSAALLAEYERIVVAVRAVSPDLVKAFAGFNL